MDEQGILLPSVFLAVLIAISHQYSVTFSYLSFLQNRKQLGLDLAEFVSCTYGAKNALG